MRVDCKLNNPGRSHLDTSNGRFLLTTSSSMGFLLATDSSMGIEQIMLYPFQKSYSSIPLYSDFRFFFLQSFGQ